MYIGYKKQFKAFSLSEVIVVVATLGVIAGITIPTLVKNHMEKSNRTKLNKAMIAYEEVINKIVIENNLKANSDVKSFANNNNCVNTKKYFKPIQDGADNCKFRTSDNVWWDISDIENPVISLKDEITNANINTIKENSKSLKFDKTSFSMVGHFDNINNNLRVNDNTYEQSQANNTTYKKYMAKLWSYASNKNIESLSEFEVCKLNNQPKCVINVNGVDVTYTRVTTTSDITISKKSDGKDLCIYNSDTKTKTCGYTSTAKSGDFYIADIGAITGNDAQSVPPDPDCTIMPYCGRSNSYAAAKKKCEEQGARLANLAELEIARTNGLFSSNNSYYSDERADGNAIYGMNENGDVGTMYIYFTYRGIICVGDE